MAAQYQYSLVVREIENEFIDLCLSEGIGMVPWGPLGGGFLSGKYKAERRPEAVEEGRLATTPDHYEEAWSKRANAHNWGILEAIQEVIGAHPSSTTSQVSLAWLLARPAVCSVILGARTVEQLEDNLKSVELVLSQPEVSLLDEASAFEEIYPYRYLRQYGAAR